MGHVIKQKDCVAIVQGKNGRKIIKNFGERVGEPDITKAVKACLHNDRITHVRLIKKEMREKEIVT